MVKLRSSLVAIVINMTFGGRAVVYERYLQGFCYQPHCHLLVASDLVALFFPPNCLLFVSFFSIMKLAIVFAAGLASHAFTFPAIMEKALEQGKQAGKLLKRVLGVIPGFIELYCGKHSHSI
jgi:hypothetical protein